jgi:hypothetical protein
MWYNSMAAKVTSLNLRYFEVWHPTAFVGHLHNERLYNREHNTVYHLTDKYKMLFRTARFGHDSLPSSGLENRSVHYV